jgi:cellulose synthase/poly-beta-1,6-N-acetylglucosamine synthase-like glycosyltransferase
MSLLLWAWLGATLLTCLVWASRHLQINRANRLMPPLHSGLYSGPQPPLPSVSLLVAAKDEADNIEACLASLLRQDYPGLQIIAVNDRSGDATGQIMDRMATGDGRLCAVHVAELPDGWFGKNHAMREGVRRATGEWLCFTDADCVQVSVRSLTVAMRFALARGADFLSVLPAHDAHGFWENVIQPACSGIMMIWFKPMDVNNPRRKAAYANGAFMLMRRSCYDAIGGHEAVRLELNEDMHMARRAKAAGHRLLVVSNDDLYTVRMYQSLAGIWNGWTRIFLGCFGTLRRLAVSFALVIAFTLLPWVAALTWAVATVAGLPLPAPWAFLGPAAWAAGALQLSVTVRFYALNHTPRWCGLLYPIGAAVGCGALANAIRRLLRKRTVTWRGTTYTGTGVATARPAPAK